LHSLIILHIDHERIVLVEERPTFEERPAQEVQLHAREHLDVVGPHHVLVPAPDGQHVGEEEFERLHVDV